MTITTLLLQKVSAVSPKAMKILKNRWGAVDKLTAAGKKSYGKSSKKVTKELLGKGVSKNTAKGIRKTYKGE